MITHAAPDEVLDALSIAEDALLGAGGEATVYALDSDRVARVHRPRTSQADVRQRAALLGELAASRDAVPFAIPEVLDTLAVDEHFVTIERRLPGRALSDVLEEASGNERVTLIRAYLEAAARIGDLRLGHAWYGDLSGREPIRTQTFKQYLRTRAHRNLAAAGREFASVDPHQIAAALPEPASPALVHLDAFPGNMLAHKGEITAVIDFGIISLMGDRRLDPLTATAYLDPAISPCATDEDRRVAIEWLRERDLLQWYEPTRRWLGAFWSCASDDVRLLGWCRSILLPGFSQPEDAG